MKPVDEQPSTCIDFDTENDNEYSYFKVCDHVRIPNIKIVLERLSSKLVRRSVCN